MALGIKMAAGSKKIKEGIGGNIKVTRGKITENSYYNRA